MTASQPHRRTFLEIFAAPLAVALISLVGLLAALIGDGWWDGLSWVALAVPALLYLYFVWRRGDGRRD
jgi:hypothetical protein